MTTFTETEKLRELDRELGQRRRVYPRLVAGGRMTQQASDRQIAILEAIRADVAGKATKERLL